MRSDLAKLLGPPNGAGTARVLLVAAHPDDETLGAGILLTRLRDAHVLLVTDGAPAERAWWGDPEQPSRASYAALRAAEFGRAMTTAGIGPERLHSLGVVDQQASFHLPDVALATRDVIRLIRPRLVLTHPYEGGHPDHDACAFTVRAAVQLLAETAAGGGERRTEPSTSESSRYALPIVAEFTSYHAAPDGGVVTGRFLGADTASEIASQATDQEREVKRAMLACYASQRTTLSGLATDSERFRLAPVYDFTRTPHAGELHYERYAWGTNGAGWRELARSALAALGLREPHLGEEVGLAEQEG